MYVFMFVCMYVWFYIYIYVYMFRFSTFSQLGSHFLLGRARLIDVCLFRLGELQYALDGLQVAL